MINLIKLLCAKIFGGHNERLDGATLFSAEYGTEAQYLDVLKLYRGKPVIRMPFIGSEYNAFKRSAWLADQGGITVVAQLDFGTNDSMMDRLSIIKKDFTFIKHIELFNELPHMVYPGEPIKSLEELIVKTNRYSDWIHQNINGVKVITMAPYNSIDERAFPPWGGVTNTRILKDLILYTTADISAVHIYGDSLGKQMEMVKLANSIKEWNREASHKKKIWITEIGEAGWKYHVEYYHRMVRLAVNVLKPDKVIWYRQTISNILAPDALFALESRKESVRSPLWNELKG